MSFNTCEGEKKFFGSIVTAPADNLGSHALGGFKEGFSALRPCRQCMANSEDFKLKVSSNTDRNKAKKGDDEGEGNTNCTDTFALGREHAL